METKDYIIMDSSGNALLDIESISEDELSNEPSFKHCLAVVTVGGEHLLGFNGWRSRYEIFGGCAEKGETARECIERECGEELGLGTSGLVYLGAMKLRLKPDWFSAEERIEYGGLYGLRLPEMTLEDIYKGVSDKDEIRKLALYRDIKGSEPIAEIDEKLLEYYK